MRECVSLILYVFIGYLIMIIYGCAMYIISGYEEILIFSVYGAILIPILTNLICYVQKKRNIVMIIYKELNKNDR